MSKANLCTDLEVWSEGVREPHVAGESRENEVPHLDAVGRNDVTEAVVVVTEELREVVQQDQKDPQRTAVQPAVHTSVVGVTNTAGSPVNGFGQLRIPQEGREELEQGCEQLSVHRPPLLLRREGQDPSNEDTMGHDFQPGVSKTRSLQHKFMI